jgi:hypothetical protein
MVLPERSDAVACRWPRVCLALVAALCLGSGVGRGRGPAPATPDPVAADIDRLIAELGDPDYAVRELASETLAAAGATAADALLAAAEESTDLEVALRAGWLAASIPLATGRESPEAARLLEAYAAGDLPERVRIMRRLLRLDHDRGLESLARIVRLEREPLGSQIAAALIVHDWQPDDPYWPHMVPGILAGLGNSNRPAARFLRGLAEATTAASPAAAAAAADSCRAVLDRLTDADPATIADTADDAEFSTPVLAGRMFRRCLSALFASQGQTSEALAVAAPLFPGRGHAADTDRLADDLQWLAAQGLPEAVDLVADRLDAESSPVLSYAAALAWRQRQGTEAAAQAAERAALAHRQLDDADTAERLGTAILLAQWGGGEWVDDEYLGILAGAPRPAERALTAITYSEFLHDQGRDAEAEGVLREILEAEGQQAEDLEQGLMQLGRDPREIRSRMLFFSAAHAEDEPTRRQRIEESLRAYPDDIDTLIAAYRLTAAEPDRRADLVARIGRTAAALDRELRNLPSEPSLRNEYAWLIANTEGDLAKATRYSRESLEASFDQASYLDTLAHCQAAAGQLEQAIRTQWLAVKQEPHSLLIRRNLDRFRSLSGVQP